MSKLRITGGILVGFGSVLGGAALLAMAGIMPLNIDFFGFNLDTHGERIAWILVWFFAVAVGIAFLRVGRRDGTT